MAAQKDLRSFPAVTHVRSKSFGEDGDSTNSEAEYQQALEVIFNGEKQRRRRDSVTSSDWERQQETASKGNKQTQCKVHQLLECQQKARRAKKQTALNGVQEEDKPLHKNAAEPDTHGDGLFSRMMTKKQLSDMALGVRDLSKRLGKIKLKINVKSVFILTKIVDKEVVRQTRVLAEWLLSKDQDTKYVVYVENVLEKDDDFDAKGLLEGDASKAGRLKYWTNEMCKKHPQQFDFVVSLGGDGTVLYASWLFQRIVPPVLSFALGSLGFLTKFDFSDHQSTLKKAFSEGVCVSLRLRFECTVMRAIEKSQEQDLVDELTGDRREKPTHKPDGAYEILNDVVVDRGPNPTMSALEVCGDNEHFTTIQADGVCVATPTGSTAYNLSAGGSLCHPDNPVILVTAICAHTLSFRPIILPDTIVLRIGNPYDARTSSWASFDGRERVELMQGDYITISASRFPFANVMPDGRRSEEWIHSISEKLQWNSRQRQKAFKDDD